ncbi:MAG: lamin tail domain-containing protein [Desulfobacterales bacterium]|nr:lamin tail domain-containing protein [Desulfobacterales bacterium]
MAGIYQEIWNADQDQNGIEAILDTETGSQDQGYVKVNSRLESSSDPELRVLTEVHIPPHKKRTYDLCRKLFNNYALAEPMPEFDTPQERQEVHDFVTAIVATEPMEVARRYVARETGSTVSRERWYNTIVEMWFRRFSSGGDPALSGFEHVVVGEQERSKVQGYHFWWKYHLDDGLAHLVDDGMPTPDLPGLDRDRITYHGSKQRTGQRQFPESVTISYRWQAPDYENEAFRPLFKKIGGFFVGCSVEGLMALGTVRAHKGVRAPRVAVIEGARYDMKLYHSPNGQHIRTFYPVFQGAADPADGGNRDNGDVTPPENGNGTAADPNPVRIISAMVNPPGHDVGQERVTLVNVAPDTIPITNWRLEDKNGRQRVLDDKVLAPGEFFTVHLSGEDVQLSNKGGEIRLYDAQAKLAHRVSYAKAQVRRQGATILF